ncbi:MAG: hypothetical protein AAGC76_11200 [Luteibacter sp.]|uniref:hypothetical protein n=1 Tax=Luteibacter sp. TaxID=1886636 RepID=UPI0028091064|nr:hypothetical protein [Luteibacter sp.]MDQ7996407.1 hypothetical protein [Luteibacter sp.]MDQ8047965.1 hypothetical protein [Luteibacter sp.]
MKAKLRGVALACVAMVATVAGTSTHARILQPGESLMAGESMHSEDGRYVAIMQGDGNFVVYRIDGAWRAIWSTNTHGRGAVQAIMQRDGNFVLYDAAGRAVWWTASNGRDRTFIVTEHGQAMVVAPGKVPSKTKGPGTSHWRQHHVKPVWAAREYDRATVRGGNGPHCIGDPHTCGAKLHGPLHQGR